MDPQSEMNAVRGCPSGAVPPAGKGKEGEERGASSAALRKADTRGTGRLEPTACVWHKQGG